MPRTKRAEPPGDDHSGRAREATRTLSPGKFALVMASVIVSIAMRNHHAYAISSSSCGSPASLVFPGDFGTGSLGTGAAVTTAGYVAAQCPPAPTQAQCLHEARSIPPEEIMVRAVDGPAGS